MVDKNSDKHGSRGVFCTKLCMVANASKVYVQLVITKPNENCTALEVLFNPLYKTHYENTPIQIYRKFHLKKLKNVR